MDKNVKNGQKSRSEENPFLTFWSTAASEKKPFLTFWSTVASEEWEFLTCWSINAWKFFTSCKIEYYMGMLYSIWLAGRLPKNGNNILSTIVNYMRMQIALIFNFRKNFTSAENNSSLYVSNYYGPTTWKRDCDKWVPANWSRSLKNNSSALREQKKTERWSEVTLCSINGSVVRPERRKQEWKCVLQDRLSLLRATANSNCIFIA